jgi:NAD(P)-dependent dehydrogenase (short-subunit alcohol dehydrogenase family)
MRVPRGDVLAPSERLRVLQLDVTDARSIRQAIVVAGPIDVLVNNAGFGVPCPVELTSHQTVRELFETNTFGTIAVTQAVLPPMRERGSGVIVNVTSSVTHQGDAPGGHLSRGKGGRECVLRVAGEGA